MEDPDGGLGMPRDPKIRTEFSGATCLTTAYPSVGGVVVGDYTAVELRYLGLSNLKPANRSSDDAEEDDLALRMMSLGAHWWTSWDFYARHYVHMTRESEIYDYHFPPNVQVGYPSSGGVWVLKFSQDKLTFDNCDPRTPYLPPRPNGLDRVQMALTMDERCEVLKSLCATFYENVGDCKDIPKTLEEGIERAERYKPLLERMEDDVYRFCFQLKRRDQREWECPEPAPPPEEL